MESMLTLDEVVSFLKFSRDTVYRLAQGGEMPAVKIGSQWRFLEGDISSWLSCKSNSADTAKESKTKRRGRVIYGEES